MKTVVAYLIFPAVLTGSVVLLWLLLATQLPMGISLLIASAANIITVAMLELVLPYDRTWKWWGHGQTINDILHGIATSEVGPRLAAAGLVGVVVTLGGMVTELTSGGLWPHNWHFGWQLLLAIIMVDFTEWGKHWTYHNVGIFWPIHALHHDTDRMNVTKGMRLHLFEGTVRYVIITAMLTILGAPIEILIWHTALLTFNGSLNHSNLDLKLPGFVHAMIQSPQVHRLHHSLDPDLGRSNLASLTTIPDHLFGTFRNPSIYHHGELGIHNSPIPGNWFLQILAPVIWLPLVWLRAQKNKKRSRTSNTR